MRILVVDDDPFALKLLTSELTELGHSGVMAYSNAYTALSVLDTAADAVDVVFLDLQMPGMDGVEFIRQLVTVGYENALILISGEDERILQTAGKLAQAHKLNILGSLSKPTYPDRIKSLLDGYGPRLKSAAAMPGKIYSREELQRALADNELVNFYQPKVEISTGRVVGVESLVRWQHPEDGLVYPDHFVPAMEEHGLIDGLTGFVLPEALRQLRDWRDQGLHLRVAVNVSMDNLVALDFPELVERAASDTGTPLTDLILEVTESRLMQNPLAALDILTRLRLKRVSLSIDDFGTGHSSLAQLRDIPFDELKIDRGFVTGAHNRSQLRMILEASLNLAHDLNIKTVAEGVEKREDWDFLRNTHCNLVQGYFIAKPMPAEDLVQWVNDWEELINTSKLIG